MPSMSRRKWWSFKARSFLFSSEVQLSRIFYTAHDFFEPQPVKDADVFMLRHVVHDWSDERTVKILQRLRDVAKPTTQLLIIENIMPLVSGAESDIPRVKSIPGAIRSPAPSPLLPNYGISTAQLYYYDITASRTNIFGIGADSISRSTISSAEESAQSRASVT